MKQFKIIAALCYITFVDVVCKCNYGDNLYRLKLLTTKLRRRYLDAVLLIKFLKAKFFAFHVHRVF